MTKSLLLVHVLNSVSAPCGPQNNKLCRHTVLNTATYSIPSFSMLLCTLLTLMLVLVVFDRAKVHFDSNVLFSTFSLRELVQINWSLLYYTLLYQMAVFRFIPWSQFVHSEVFLWSYENISVTIPFRIFSKIWIVGHLLAQIFKLIFCTFINQVKHYQAKNRKKGIFYSRSNVI